MPDPGSVGPFMVNMLAAQRCTARLPDLAGPAANDASLLLSPRSAVAEVPLALTLALALALTLPPTLALSLARALPPTLALALPLALALALPLSPGARLQAARQGGEDGDGRGRAAPPAGRDTLRPAPARAHRP